MENNENTIKLDNKEISLKEFNEIVDNLKPNQRLIETQDKSFHIVERLRG